MTDKKHGKDTVAEALRILSEDLCCDPEYWEAWKANIAMFVWDAIIRDGVKDDDRVIHAACNKGADDFLRCLTRDL